MQKRGFSISTHPAELTWHVGPARMRHGIQGHMAAPRGPMRRGGANTWQDHASPRGRPGGATWQHDGGLQVKGDKVFYPVVKTHRCWSKKIYNSELTITKI